MATVPTDQINQMLRSLMRSIGETSASSSSSSSDMGGSLQSGETRGPYPIRELGAEPSEGENMITLLDQLGHAHHFEVQSVDPILRRIRPCVDARMANCVVLHIENLIQLMVVSDIGPTDDLVAAFLPQHMPSTANETDTEKRYHCNICNIAKFNCMDNLVAHQKIYCSKRENVSPQIAPQPQLPSTSVPSISGVNLPNVILLPLAYHDQPQTDLVQLLGPPQTIVPVAVGRNHSTITNPILLQRSLCASVTMPINLQYTVGGVAVTIPVLNIESAPTSLKRPQSCSTSTPLDLSKRPRESTSGETTPAPAVAKPLSSDIEKPFLCSCGVAFSADATLKAHQQFYCKDVERTEEMREPARKLPSRCSQCDFEPQSLSQLSNHVRTAHNDVQAYVCKVCGYRGYSLRGIRSHMRSHPTLDYMKFDALLASHVSKVKTETKTPDTD